MGSSVIGPNGEMNDENEVMIIAVSVEKGIMNNDKVNDRHEIDDEVNK